MAGTRSKRKSTAAPKNTKSNKIPKVSEDKKPEDSSFNAVAAAVEVPAIVEEIAPAIVVENTPAIVEENASAIVEENAPATSSGRRSDQADVVEEEDSKLIGDPVPDAEARKQWPHRYLSRKVRIFTL